MGKTPSRDNPEYWNGSETWVSISDMGSSKYISSSKECITKKAVDESGIKKVPEGCVIMSFKLSVGKSAITCKELYTNEAIMAFKPRKGYALLSDFIYYYLKGYKWDGVNRAAMGLTLNKASISKGIFSYPSLKEQERIVAELDLLTGIIDKQKQQLKELDNLAQSIFYDMFGNPMKNERKWNRKTLGEIGKIISGSTPSTSDDSNWDGDVNWVTPAELNVQLFYGETQRKITTKAARNLTIMPVGTVLLSSRAPIGKLAITTVPMCCNQGFKNIICGAEVNNIFLYYYLMLNMDSIKAMGRGATFKEVSKSAISMFEVIVPSMSLQESFAQKIQTIESQKESIKKSIEESQKLFDYTMNKYFG